MSPRVLFSVSLGLGTAGLVLRPILGGPALFAAALALGIFFERIVVTPLWNFMFRFASTPALTLESAVTDEARAVTTFDANGQGLISVELDGQSVQLLGTLQSSDRAMHIRVPAGARSISLPTTSSSMRIAQRSSIQEQDNDPSSRPVPASAPLSKSRRINRMR